jgi:hypothetical protein
MPTASSAPLAGAQHGDLSERELELRVEIHRYVNTPLLDPVVARDYVPALVDLPPAFLQQWLKFGNVSFRVANEVRAEPGVHPIETALQVRFGQHGEAPGAAEQSARDEKLGRPSVPRGWVHPVPGVAAPYLRERLEVTGLQALEQLSADP